jgi:hypothetical protein
VVYRVNLRASVNTILSDLGKVSPTVIDELDIDITNLQVDNKSRLVFQ